LKPCGCCRSRRRIFSCSPDSPTSHLSANPWSLNLLLVAAGIVTTVPLLFFTAAATRLRLSTLGFFQYLGPTLMFLLAVTFYGENCRPGQAGDLWLYLGRTAVVYPRRALYPT
jgi:EamA domain-containing membrane protein RarD